MIKSFAFHWVTSPRPKTTQPSFHLFFLSTGARWGCSYLTAMSPSRAQQVLWICDSALCTYVRCSQDSKSSPHPPSAICLEMRNWQAWATSRQTVLQGWGPESREEWGQRAFGCPQFSAARRSSARGRDCPESLRVRQPSAKAILQAQDLGGAVSDTGESMRSQGIHPAPPESHPGPGGR